jgi:glyoxylase-like metal-dependent hydrolase (beta-lactamase superfamily II)
LSSQAQPAPSAEESLALAARAGIHRLAVPTPFLVGRVNCYLLDDEPLTLVDTGPNSGKSLDELERLLAGHGRRIEDLELIVLTHQHMDHIGLVEILVRRSGADVAALHSLGPYLANFGASAAADDDFSQEIMRRHGVPYEISIALGSVGAAFRAFGSSADVSRPLHDGDELELGQRRLRVLHRPGHSPSDTVFFDEARGIALCGDHLIAHISSNPLVTRPLDGDASSERPQALVQYIESMRATRELEASLLLSGHGEPIVDHVGLIDERLRMHRRRAGKIMRLLEAAPLSAYEIAVQIWGNVAVTQAYLTLSEVLGHLDVLVNDGEARELDDGEVVRFAVAGHG